MIYTRVLYPDRASGDARLEPERQSSQDIAFSVGFQTCGRFRTLATFDSRATPKLGQARVTPMIVPTSIWRNSEAKSLCLTSLPLDNDWRAPHSEMAATRAELA